MSIQEINGQHDLRGWLKVWATIGQDALSRPVWLIYGEVRHNAYTVTRGRVLSVSFELQPASSIQPDPARPFLRIPLCEESARVTVKMVIAPGATMTLTLWPWVLRQIGPDEWEVPAWADAEDGEPARRECGPAGEIVEEWVVAGGRAW